MPAPAPRFTSATCATARSWSAIEEANELLARGTALFDGQLAGAHTVTNRSTPEGLASLAQQIGAEAVVFCSDSHTARGHISIGNSAQRLLEGGPVAVAIAPVGSGRGRRR